MAGDVDVAGRPNGPCWDGQLRGWPGQEGTATALAERSQAAPAVMAELGIQAGAAAAAARPAVGRGVTKDLWTQGGAREKRKYGGGGVDGGWCTHPMPNR